MGRNGKQQDVNSGKTEKIEAVKQLTSLPKKTDLSDLTHVISYLGTNKNSGNHWEYRDEPRILNVWPTSFSNGE